MRRIAAASGVWRCPNLIIPPFAMHTPCRTRGMSWRALRAGDHFCACFVAKRDPRQTNSRRLWCGICISVMSKSVIGGASDQAIAKFAVAYADQTERDHAALVKAVRNGWVTAIEGT